MAEASLLGCPHCGKPIAFSEELAGRLAACPHCRGPFQMPASPPPSTPITPPPSPPPIPERRLPQPQLAFDAPSDAPGSSRPRREPRAYETAERWSLVLAVSGCILSLLAGVGLAIFVFVPLFNLPGPRAFLTGLLGTILALAVIVAGMAGSILVQNLTLVIVDAARNLRGEKPAGSR